MCTLRLVYSCWKYKQQPSRVGAAASLGNTGCFIYIKENFEEKNGITLAGNINNNQVDVELQPHLVIQGVS